MPVIAIGLDAAALTLIERWTATGELPVLAGLRARGTFAPLRSFPHHTAETAWTTFLTGCTPPTVGYWSPIQLRQGSYDIEHTGAYDFQEFAPFYELGSSHRVAIFDAPQTRISQNVNGIQVLAWGAHSPQTSSTSVPAGLLEELTAAHGPNPLLRKDSASIYAPDSLVRLKEGLITGIERRAAICRDLVQRERWDLFLTVFDCFHSAGHYFWHLSDPKHPLHSLALRSGIGDLLREIFVAADRAIGDIIEKAPADAAVVVFSPHGMEANVLDLASCVFLPELLYRFSFPGRAAMAASGPGTPDPQVPAGDVLRDGWTRAVWKRTRERSAIKTALKRHLPSRYYSRLEPLLGSSDMDPVSPFRSGKPTWMQKSQPGTWFQHLWPQMKAFALPSFSDGYIRINLQGREPQGIVAPADYERVCTELTEMLLSLTDARSGRAVVDSVIRARAHSTDDARLPAADLVVRWKAERPTDVVDSPTLGRVGPVPFTRSGGHCPDGFVIACGDGIPAGASLPEGRAIDLGPTLLHLMSAAIPAHLEGRPLVERSRLEFTGRVTTQQLCTTEGS